MCCETRGSFCYVAVIGDIAQRSIKMSMEKIKTGETEGTLHEVASVYYYHTLCYHHIPTLSEESVNPHIVVELREVTIVFRSLA